MCLYLLLLVGVVHINNFEQRTHPKRIFLARRYRRRKVQKEIEAAPSTHLPTTHPNFNS
jgi:hypothetical protein